MNEQTTQEVVAVESLPEFLKRSSKEVAEGEGKEVQAEAGHDPKEWTYYTHDVMKEAPKGAFTLGGFDARRP